MESTLRLFKAVPVQTVATFKPTAETIAASASHTLPLGFIFAPSVLVSYPNLNKLTASVVGLYGRDATTLNQAFHKSWNKVRTADIRQLVAEQIVHYITTYGFEQAGFFSIESIYVPPEALSVAEFKDPLRVVVIRGLTKDQLRDELGRLLASGVALSEQSIADVVDVALFVGVDEDFVNAVRNREVRAALYTYLGIVPVPPVEFLRYVVFEATGKTVLVKNAELFSAIREGATKPSVSRAFDTYAAKVGLARLGEIFLRYKPIFLAFRANTHLRSVINEIRRQARSNHQPLAEDRLNTVTARLGAGKNPLDIEFLDALKKASIFRKARLAYALRFRMSHPDAVVYRLRHGKSWTTGFSYAGSDPSAALEVVLGSIVTDLVAKVAGRSIYIPAGVHYALPATEKMFTGNLPSGTYVEVDKHLVAGVHWSDVENDRIDLDLSLLDAYGKYGWDGSYRSADRGILFSGDQTAAPAPLGASEFFYLNKDVRGQFLMVCNYFNFSPVNVPFQIMVAKGQKPNATRNNVIDPNRIVAQAHSVMTERQRILGIIVAEESWNRFYFAEFAQSGGRSARANKRADQTRSYLLNYYLNAIDLNELLARAGAQWADEAATADIDLTPEAVDKTTLINLFQS